MSRLAYLPAWLRTIVLTAAAAGLLTTAAALAVVVALMGLGRLASDLDLLRAARWLWYFRADPDVARWTHVGGYVAGLSILTLTGLAVLRIRRPLYGAARWAGASEVSAADLRADEGIILGQKAGRLIRFGGEEHVLLHAPTRTGKGVGIVIPNLLTWPDSALVLDIKQENWAATAGARAALGQPTHLFDPLARDRRTARYNPLGHIDRADRTVTFDELQRLSVMLFPTSNHADSFWAEAARTGFLGVSAYVAETPHLPFTLGEIYRQLMVSDAQARFPAEIETRSSSARPLSMSCVAALQDFCSGSDRTFASVKQTISSRMGLFLNPLVDAATSESDFDLSTMREERTSIYLGAAPEDLPRIAPLYALLLQQFLDFTTRRMPASTDAPVLVVLDEFTKLGAMTLFAQAFSFVAGYGVRLLCVLQSPSQLRAHYGPDFAEDMMANCGVEVVFAPRDIKVAQTLSARLGAYGQDAHSYSRPVGLSDGRRSVSTTEHSRALMLPQELIELAPHELLILRAGARPVRARKIRYFQDRRFRNLVRPAPEVPVRASAPAGASSLGASTRRFEEVDEIVRATPNSRSARGRSGARIHRAPLLERDG